MTKHDYIKYGIILFLAVVVTILVITIFSRRKETDSIYFQKYMAAQDSLVKSKQNEVEAYKNSAQQTRESYLEMRRSDSINFANYVRSTQLFQQTLNAQLKKVPINIAAISNSDSAIRRAFADFR